MPLGEQREADVNHVHLQKHRKLADDGLTEADAAAGLPYHAQLHEALAHRVARNILGRDGVKTEATTAPLNVSGAEFV